MEICYRLRVAWNGAAYVGWQRQPEGRSLQAVFEDAVAQLLGQRCVVTASGRTDAGVHVAEQVLAFRAPVERAPYALLRGLNATLPKDVVVLSVEVAPPDFDVRGWVRRKRYRYRVLHRVPRCPFRDGLVFQWRGALSVADMHAAAQALIGTHDYTSFRAQGCGARHAVRKIEAASVLAEGDEIHMDVVGNGFLRHQVRIIAGTLLEIGQGKRPVSSMAETLAARHRNAAGPTAAACGLWLMQVELGDGPNWLEPTDDE